MFDASTKYECLKFGETQDSFYFCPNWIAPFLSRNPTLQPDTNLPPMPAQSPVCWVVAPARQGYC